MSDQKLFRLEKLFEKGLLKNPFPAYAWETIVTNEGKKLTWLRFFDGFKNVQTSMDKKKWGLANDQFRADFLNTVKKKYFT